MQLRDYQQEAVDSVWSTLCSRRGNPLIVLPTGAGKSLVIAKLCQDAIKKFDGRVIVLAHRKELIEQNADKIKRLVSIPVGFYSAGLNRKQINEPIIVAGIQSAAKHAADFGQRNLVVIDEAHLVPHGGEGMYRKFLSDLQMYNPQLKYAGLTATPYRLGEGHLVGKESLWGLISYEAKIPQLISEGFLCPITNKPTATHFDLDRMHLRGGEFVASEMEDVFADAEKVQRSVTEILAKTADRHSVIVFCSGVRHAQYVRDVIEEAGKTCGMIDGQTGKLERAGIIRAFQKQDIQYLVNIDVLTTGFDAPNIDAIAILRSTMSAGLFVQMCGRGFRIHDSKQDCLILDFGGNIDRHGPLDAIDYGRARAIREGNLKEHDGPLKSCPGCSEDIPASTRTCVCGFEFPPPELKHDERADEASSILAEPQTFPVSQWQFSRHVKKDSDKPNTLRVDYYIQGDLETTISEWVCLLHDGFAGKKARKWWAEHSEDDIDSLSEMLGMDQIDVALQLFADGEIKEPIEITAIKDGNFWRVLSRVVDEPRQREDATSIWEHEELPF